MKIFFLTTNDRVFLPRFFEKVFSDIGDDIAGLAIVEDPHFLRFLKRSFLLMGIRLFTLEIISQLKIRLLDLFDSVFRPAERRSIVAVCGKYGIPVFSVGSVNSDEFRDSIRKMEIDMIISVACPQILGRKLLESVSRGCINVHYGLLPNYRGMYPSFWVLANGEKETGVSVHYMGQKIDAGGIITQKKEKIRDDDTFYSLVARLKTTIGPEALSEAVEKIRMGNPEVMPNDPDAGSYFSFPTRADMKRFLALGRKWR